MALGAQTIIGVVPFPKGSIVVVSMPDFVPLAAPIVELVALRDFFAEQPEHAWL